MSAGNAFRGTGLRLSGFGVICLLLGAGLGAPLHAQTSSVHTVGLLVTNPNSADASRDPDSAYATEGLRVGLESTIQTELATIDGVDVRVMSRDPQVDLESYEKKWVRENKFSFYVRANLIPSYGGEKGVNWLLADLRKTSDLSQAKKYKGEITTIGDKTRFQDMEKFAAVVGGKVRALTTGVKPKNRNVLISCFLLAVTRTSPSLPVAALSQIELTLPSQLPALLQQGWKDKGYNAEGLDPMQVQTLCVDRRDAARLEDLKLRADYVIEGVIKMRNAEEMQVDLSVRRRAHSLPLKEPFYRDRKSIEQTIPAMAEFISRNWPALVQSDDNE